MSEKSKDNELSTNSEVKRSDEFQSILNIKTTVIDLIKELLISTTGDEFSKLGYEKVEKYASVDGNEKHLGHGVEENKYCTRLAGKTKTNIEKQIFFGTKRVEAEINIIFKGTVLNLEYKTPESGYFRGVDKVGKTFMINEKQSFKTDNLKTLKKELTELFKQLAKKEVGYLIDTKLGVEDKMEKSTTSTVEENYKLTNNMKKLTLKEFFSVDEPNVQPENINEIKSAKVEPHIEKIKTKNTIPLKDISPKSKKVDKNKFLLFDKEDKELEEIYEEKFIKDSSMGKEEYIEFFKNEMKKMFGTTSLGSLTPVEKKEFFNHIDKIYASKKEMEDANLNELTASGPMSSGAGAYLTPVAFKKEGMLKDVKNTLYYKNRQKRPRVTKDWNVVPEAKNSSFPYGGEYSTTHVKGHPGVKPGSKAEEKLSMKGLNKSKKLNENIELDTTIITSYKKPDLTQRKFFSEQENKDKGINKRYLITEKTTDEYLKERWEKLSNFKLYESITETEELITEFINIEPTLEEEIIDIIEESNNVNNISEINNSEILEEETVEVEKPGNMFGTTYKFYKKDFLNESQRYILDLNTFNFVENPNVNNRTI